MGWGLDSAAALIIAGKVLVVLEAVVIIGETYRLIISSYPTCGGYRDKIAEGKITVEDINQETKLIYKLAYEMLGNTKFKVDIYERPIKKKKYISHPYFTIKLEDKTGIPELKNLGKQTNFCLFSITYRLDLALEWGKFGFSMEFVKGHQVGYTWVRNLRDRTLKEMILAANAANKGKNYSFWKYNCKHWANKVCRELDEID